MTSRRRLFRRAALERLSTPDQLDTALRVTGARHWAGMAAVCLLAAGAILWGVLGSAPVTVATQGILIAEGGILDVTAGHGGRLTDFTVRPGQRVERGAVVARLDQPDLAQDLAQAREALAEARERRDLIASFQARQHEARTEVDAARRAALEQVSGHLRERLRWLEERDAYEGDLIRSGAIPRQRRIDTRIDLNAARQELTETANALSQVAMEERAFAIAQQRELLDLDLEIAALRRRVDALDGRLARESTVVSPYEGEVAEVKVAAGDMLAEGAALFSLLPAGRPEETVAILFASPTDGKKIRPGMAVNVSPSTVKAAEFGFIRGEVISVASIPATREGMGRVLRNEALVATLSGQGAPLEVRVRLARDPATPSGYAWSSGTGPQTAVTTGTLCEGTVILRRQRLIALVIPALEPLFDEAG